MKGQNADIVDFVKKGLQPYNDNAREIVAPDLGEILNRYQELNLEIHNLDINFPAIRNANYDDWRILNVDREVDWDNKLIKIDFPDDSNSVVRGEYQEKKVELERLEPIFKRYPNIPSWVGYELPEKPKDTDYVINLLLDAYYKLDDVLAFEQCIRKKGTQDNIAVPKKRSLQELRGKAIAMAKEYIDKQRSKKKLPIMKDAVKLIQEKLVKGKYKDRTIHDWIKGYFPDDSRKSGRPQKK